MSLVASRLSLTHLCTIERDAEATSNGWGTPGKPDWQSHISNLACRAQVTAGHEAVDATTSSVVEDIRLLVTVDTDVTEDDRVASVTERGATIIAGPISIRAVLRHKDHLELVLVRIS